MGKGTGEDRRAAFQYVPMSAAEAADSANGRTIEYSFPAPPTDLPPGDIRLWIDDLRPVPDGWYWTKTAEEAIAVLGTGRVVRASIDHDLGQDADGNELPSGYDVVTWIEQHDLWPRDAVSVHSDNASGSSRMVSAIERSGHYDRRSGRQFSHSGA